MIRFLGMTLVAGLAVPALASPPPLAPAAGAARGTAARQQLLDQDPRLEKRVTLRQKRSPLSAVVAELARQTEVSLRASANVADEPALLFVTEQPAKEVMHQLSTHFGFRWSRGTKGGVATYELYQDLRSKQDEEALRAGRHARALAALQVSLREQMRLAQRPAQLLLREAAALEARQPAGGGSYRLREMADPCRRALLQVASLLTADQWKALERGETVHFSTPGEPGAMPLPPALAQALQATRPTALPAGVRPGFVTAEDEAGYRREEERSQEAWSRAQGYCVSAQLSLTSSEAHSEAVLSITPAATMPADGPEAPALVPTVIVYGRGAAAPEAREPSETPRSWQDDPILSRKCRLRTEPAGDDEEAGSLPAILAAIAESAGINLVADAYRAQRASFPISLLGGERSLYEALSQYVEPSAGWRREGEFFRVRSHRWYQLRPREVPERIVAEWAARLRKAERLTLEDSAAVALSLRDEQLPQFEAALREAGVQIGLGFAEEGPGAGRIRAILRAYGSLHPEQRRLLDAGGSVAAAALPPLARRWLHTAWISGGHRATPAAAHGEAMADTLSLAVDARSPEGIATKVRFRYHTGSRGPEEFRVALPRVWRRDSTRPALSAEGREAAKVR
jgi:hypothetical protein